MSKLRRAAALACLGVAAAGGAAAIRVETGAAPAASAVLAAAQQPQQQQADESASLRQGVVTKVDERRGRIQVHGVWLDLAAGKSRLVRRGRPAELGSLKAGEQIRFTVAPESSGAQTVRLIYVP